MSIPLPWALLCGRYSLAWSYSIHMTNSHALACACELSMLPASCRWQSFLNILRLENIKQVDQSPLGYSGNTAHQLNPCHI